MMNPSDDQERSVWDLLTRDFYWDIPPQYPVQIYGESGSTSGPVRLQIFEIAITAIFARIKPEYEWRVSPNRPDSGLDFIGVHTFLDDRELGIAAAITIGGQCKKRTRVDDVVGEVAGSLVRMGDKMSPTFFVVAFSAHLTQRRVEQACEMLERQFGRQCHILDRTQIEGLFGEHLEALTEILRVGLSGSEVEEVMSYFEGRRRLVIPPAVTFTPPPRVLAGVPFRVEVNVSWIRASDPDARIWWRPGPGAETDAVTLVGPVGADGAGGSPLISVAPGSDPLTATCTIELVTHVVGSVDLGDISVGIGSADLDAAERVAAGRVDVVETMRPRFFDHPYRAGLHRLSSLYDEVLAGSVASVGVVGAGGSGKSRMCEEFALEKRRSGCHVVTAKHAKTHEEPQRVLGELLAALATDGRYSDKPADEVIRAVESFDLVLAANAAGAIRSTFGSGDSAPAEATEQSIVSTLLLLIVARSRQAPLIIHLQDLHWCSAEVLSLLERLLRQLSQLPVEGPAEGGVMFIFEGRIRESGESVDEDWSSVPFEAFLGRLDSATVACSSFTPEDSLVFTRLLFEDRHNAHRLLVDDMVQLQEELATRICQTAGGNPFHTLEQVRLLKEQGVIGQNPKTGLLYMIRPEPAGSVLPESVFEAIRMRWRYMRKRAPELALLVWGSALLDDQIATSLFRRLWRELAPEVSVRDIDATDILWTGDGAAHEVVFRHENYFESIRRFTVSETDRRRVVEAYCSYFADLSDPSPAEQFAWARALLELPDPDRARARKLLLLGLENAGNSGDSRLTRRIRAFFLDLVWSMDEQSPIKTADFVRYWEEESDLCRDFLGMDRDQAAERIWRMRERVDARLKGFGASQSEERATILRLLLTAEALQAQLLFNDRRPTEATEIASRVIASVRAQRRRSDAEDSLASLEMEALYTRSCAQAVSGEFVAAVQSSADAAEIAGHSDSLMARKILSTYGTILICKDPDKGESVLRDCLMRWPEDGTSDGALVHIHLGVVLAVQAHRLPPESEKRHAKLDEAADRMTSIHDSCRRLGFYPDAGAAALVRGVVAAIAGEGDEVAWFAQAVAAAAKGRQMETLWRSQINLAMARCRKDGKVSQAARDHALAALEIMQDTLVVYSEPEKSPRFEMVRLGMVAAAWVMLAAGDPRGRSLLEQYPPLRSHFTDPEAGILAPYDGGPRHYQWLRVDDVDYVLY
jgi:hypothetical protein